MIVEYDTIRNDLENLKELYPVFDKEFFLEVSCAYISRTFSTDANLLGKWRTSGRRALVLNYFLFFECHNRQGSLSPEKIPNQNFNFAIMQKYAPANHGIFDYHSSISYRNEIDYADKGGSEEYFFREGKKENFFSFLANSSWFRFKYDDSLCFKSGPIWKEWTEADEEVVRMYAIRMYSSINSKSHQCCTARIKAKMTVL